MGQVIEVNFVKKIKPLTPSDVYRMTQRADEISQIVKLCNSPKDLDVLNNLVKEIEQMEHEMRTRPLVLEIEK